MPTPETTYYNIKTLHRVFALSSLLLLAATLWMIVADHQRPWKRHQRAMRDVQRRHTQRALARLHAADGEATDREAARLERRLQETTATYFRRDWPPLGKKWLELPVVDLFNSPLKIDNLWAEGLTIDYNFKHVTRFDRCTTCHRGVGQPRTGEAAESFTFALATPDEAPGPTDDPAATLADVYGLRLDRFGVLADGEVAVAHVEPASRAALAACVAAEVHPVGDQMLRPGDVLVRIGAEPVNSLGEVHALLLEHVASWGESVRIVVRRGLPHPLAAHPRLDLFVGDDSPHPMGRFGCTICHQGQGSATDFRWASHTPDSSEQGEQWMHSWRWLANGHWTYPMWPARFVEAGCLQCHHDVTELDAGEQFAEPPAAKLVEGHRLIVELGCFGCHQLDGVDDAGRRTGPDMPLEPVARVPQPPGDGPRTYTGGQAARATLAAHANTGGQAARATLASGQAARATLASGQAARATLASGQAARATTASGQAARATRGDGMRRVGPSLRFVGQKLGGEFLLDWLRDPTHYQPHTRMPRSFGLWDHLEPDEIDTARSAELREMQGIAAYLLANSETVEMLEPPAVADQPERDARAQRGKTLFEMRGCLACHTHGDFPEGQAEFARDLTRLGAKLSSESALDGRRWLYTYLRDPDRLNPRTTMPNPLLEVGEVDGRPVDEAADLTEYLLTARVPLAAGKPVPGTAFTLARSASEGVAATTSSTGETPVAPRVELGRQAIVRYGCFGCHDIPGFETAGPIGPAWAGWGRKDVRQLAFHHIVAYAERSADEPIEPFYVDALRAERLDGFAMQKLREPRSFDYQQPIARPNDRLRMPQFQLTDRQREAIVTFLLGLTDRPPATPFVYAADEPRAAILRGERILDKYNCGGCHVLELAQWDLRFDRDTLEPAIEDVDFPFMTAHLPEQQLQASEAPDARGKLRATLVGLPVFDEETGRPLVLDDDDPLEAFDLFEPTAVQGATFEPGVGSLLMPASAIHAKRPTVGGDLTHLLLPRALARVRDDHPAAQINEGWAWLPPPLHRVGAKLRPDWLHGYLLDPTPIRPASLMRMPRFNLSSGEAADLAAYFAAAAGVDYPYQFSPTRRTEYLAAAERQYQQRRREVDAPLATRRLDQAMSVVVDSEYCVKCHRVGPRRPSGTVFLQAPDLTRVYQRLRPEYVRRWVASPRRLLPFTTMPVNIPFKPDAEHRGGFDQRLYPGDSTEQLRAVVDLLIHYDEQMRRAGGEQREGE